MGTKSIGEDPPSTNEKAPEENFIHDSRFIDLSKEKLIRIVKKSDDPPTGIRNTVLSEKDKGN